MRRMLIVAALMWAGVAGAQVRYEGVERRNPWIGGANAAGIRQDSLTRSFAQVAFTREYGGLCDPSASSDSWNAGAATRSVRHFDAVSFAGGFAYDYFDGRQMCGSMFTVPGYYPVDIVEFTPGRKIRESYAFDGAVAARLGRHWTGGVKVDFAARNLAKRKDLRHKNRRLDFEAAPGILYSRGRFAAGVAYLVGVDREQVSAERIGADIDYMAFFDRGLRFGALTEWEGSDLHLSVAGVDGFPVRETTQGAALQLQQGRLYADAAYRYRTGQTGENGFIWHDYDAHLLAARIVWRLGSVERSHFLRVRLDWEALDNRENVVSTETDQGITQAVVHGSVPIFARRRLEAALEWERMTLRSEFRAGVRFAHLGRQSTLMYPCVREQLLHHTTIHASWLGRLGAWELMLAADFRTGGFRERAWEFPSPDAHGDYPERLTSWYDAENEYLTCDRLGCAAGVRRNLGRFYIDLTARAEAGFGIRHLPQRYRIGATLAAGYNF